MIFTTYLEVKVGFQVVVDRALDAAMQLVQQVPSVVAVCAARSEANDSRSVLGPGCILHDEIDFALKEAAIACPT